MSLSEHAYGASAVVGGSTYPLDLEGGQVTVDEGWAPHVQADLTIAVPAPAVLELLDARVPVAARARIVVDAAIDWGVFGTQARSFDLTLRSRRYDPDTGTVQLRAASDEALLQDDVHLSDTPDTSSMAFQTSLRAIIGNMLTRIGATLEAGTVDAPYRALTDATNLILNPSFTLNNAGWGAGGFVTTPGTMSRPTSGGVDGGAYSRFTATGATTGTPTAGGVGSGVFADYVATGLWTVGAPTSLAVYARSSRSTPIGISVEFRTASAAIANYVGVGVKVAAGTWSRYVLENLIVPAGTTIVRVRVTTIGGTGYAALQSGDTFDLDQVLAVQRATVVEWFDGDTLDTTEYAYAWTGTPSGSSSTRTALIDRSPDLLKLMPGRSVWAFLQALTQAAGLRLYCDELRRWQLIDGAEHIADGSLHLAHAVNLTRSTDTIDRDSDADWFDAALVRYRWTDTDLVQQERIDWHAEPGATRTKVLELADTPYPGPGFAEAMVRRSLGRGRTLDLAAVSQLTATPAQPVVVTLPGAPIQVGALSRVTFDVGTGVMTLGTRGLTDTTPDAWLFGNEDTWPDLGDVMTWNTWTWE